MFILAPERDEDPEGAFDRYADYIRRESRRLPPAARSLATSNWYFSFDDHRAPHDAWLLSVVFEEIAAGARHDERAVSLRLRLRGAYHDHELEFCYPKVFAYTFQGRAVAFGHGDWRYDEFRLDQAGHLVHEIQWYGMGELATWVITADDVIFTSRGCFFGYSLARKRQGPLCASCWCDVLRENGSTPYPMASGFHDATEQQRFDAAQQRFATDDALAVARDLAAET